MHSALIKRFCSVNPNNKIIDVAIWQQPAVTGQKVEKFVFRCRSSKCTICMSFHLFKRFLDEKMTQTCIECFPQLFSNSNLIFSGKFQVCQSSECNNRGKDKCFGG